MGLKLRIAQISYAFFCLLSVDAGAQMNNCVITGGANFGTINQTCIINPTPVPVTIISKEFEKSSMPNGAFQHLLFMQIDAPITLLAIACGQGVTNLDASPWPAGMAATSEKMTKGDCLAYRFFNTAPGRWALWVTTKTADTKFTLQPVIEQ